MKTETDLVFQQPALLRDHFIIPADTAPWVGPLGTYSRCLDSRGKEVGFTPARKRATFGSLTQSLQPRTSNGMLLNTSYGVYLLAFDVPFPALYVGIAASSSKTPEGVLSRIRKHRVKFTSSHIGSSETTHGGVNHTGGWREFAVQRIKYFASQGITDCGPDARFVVGDFVPSGGPGSHKVEAEWFEGKLTGSERLKEHLIDLLWPGRRSGDVFLLTIGSNGGRRPESPAIRFWDGTSVTL